MSPAHHRTPPEAHPAGGDMQDMRDVDPFEDDLDEGRPSGIRPLVPPFAVPWLVIRLEGLRFLPLDARAAYLVSLVDGQCSVETILDMCGLELERQREEGLEVFANLLQLGVIELRDP